MVWGCTWSSVSRPSTACYSPLLICNNILILGKANALWAYCWSHNQLILHGVLTILYSHCFHMVIPRRIINIIGKHIFIFIIKKKKSEIVSQRAICFVHKGKQSAMISIFQGYVLWHMGSLFWKERKQDVWKYNEYLNWVCGWEAVSYFLWLMVLIPRIINPFEILRTANRAVPVVRFDFYQVLCAPLSVYCQRGSSHRQ